MIQHGMEGVFHVVAADGTITYMLQEPGRCTSSAIDLWCVDLLTTGVIQAPPTATCTGGMLGTPTCHLPCKYDRINMLWSGEALLNSCTDALKQDLKLTVDPDNHFDPKLLMSVFTKIYHPSQSKIESLKEKLKKLSV